MNYIFKGGSSTKSGSFEFKESEYWCVFSGSDAFDTIILLDRHSLLSFRISCKNQHPKLDTSRIYYAIAEDILGIESDRFKEYGRR
jgi:hypothetical protein